MPVIALLLLAWPFLEIAGFIVVGRAIGVVPTLGLLLAAMVIGFAILRELGLSTMLRLRSEMARGGVPGEAMGHSALIAVAALLLIVPGFLSDLLALALLVPPIRLLIIRLIARHADIIVVGAGERRTGERRTGERPGGRVIDLEEGEWTRHEPESHRRGPHEPGSDDPQHDGGRHPQPRDEASAPRPEDDGSPWRRLGGPGREP